VSLSVIVRFALNEPVAVGANFTEMSHELPDATFATRAPWQALVIENGTAVVPVVVWLVMFSTELPVLVSVSDKVFVGCGLDWLIFRLPKSKLAGISLTVPGVSVMVALACLVPSDTDVAVMVTLALVGTVLGAAYVVGVPLGVVALVIVPHAFEHALVPCVSVQLTPWLLESKLTLAVNGVAFNCVVAFTGMIALGGETETVMAGTVIVIEPCWVASESEVATIVTDKSLAGGVGGAV